MSQAELNDRLGGNSADPVILDIREKDAFDRPRARRASPAARRLELRVDTELPDDGADRDPLRVRADRRWPPPPCGNWAIRGQWRWTAA
jgi:hypothetical protein